MPRAEADGKDSKEVLDHSVAESQPSPAGPNAFHGPTFSVALKTTSDAIEAAKGALYQKSSVAGS